MKDVGNWISLIVGVLPGMALILNGLGTPEDLRQPFGIIAAVCGFVAFGVVLLIRGSIKRLSKKTLALLIIAFGLIGFVSLCSYWIALNRCVFHAPERSPAFFPLWLDGRGKVNVESAGGRMAYYEKYGPGAVSKLVETQSDQMDQTKLLLLALISIASFALAVSSGIGSAFPGSGSIAHSSFNGKTRVGRKVLSGKDSVKRSSRKKSGSD
jgi:hypothetical protein